MFGLGAIVGIGGTAGATKLLNESSNKGITQTENSINIDAIEAEKDIHIKNESEKDKNKKREVFVNGIKVEPDKQENKIEENTYDEVDNIKTSEEALTYVKNIYAEEYNKQNGTNISADDIEISKKLNMLTLEDKTAENGDEIKVLKAGEGYEKGIYTIKITSAEVVEKEVIAKDMKGKCVRVYDSDKEVKGYEENTASKLGEVLMSGTDYAISLEANDNDNRGINAIYKERLVQSVTEHKKQQIDELIKGEDKTNNMNENEQEKIVIEENEIG